MSTATLASLVLGSFVMGIILLAKKLNLNPDNIATPIASALGDVVTLSILTGVGTLLYWARETVWIHIATIVLFLLSLPFLSLYCFGNEFVKQTLLKGWFPIITAMLSKLLIYRFFN